MGFLASALAAAERGWFVFPLDPETNAPLTQRGFKDATRDPAQISKWSDWHGDTPRVGIATGASGLLVVDLDRKNGKDGVATWARICAAQSDDPHTLTVKTRSGGFHLIFSGVGKTSVGENGGLGSGIDTRGVGGYIAWYDSVLVDTPVVPAPAWLLALLTPRATGLPVANEAAVAAHVVPPEARRPLTHAELVEWIARAPGDLKADAKNVADGRPWGAQGGREVRLSALALALVRDFPWLDPEGTSHLFTASCRAVEAADGASTTIEWVAEKLAQKILPVAGYLATLRPCPETKAILAAWAEHSDKRDALKLAAKRQSPQTKAALRSVERGETLSAEGLELAVAALARVTDAAEAYVRPSAPVDMGTEALAAMVAEAAKDVAKAEGNDWILGTDQGYFLKAAEGYEGPFSGELMPARARDSLAYVDGLVLGEWKGQNYQPKPTSKLLNDYGRVPGSVHYTLHGATRLTGDRLLYNALHMPELEAEHNPEIAEWLRQLAGDQHEPFLDWLATFLHFERPTCAVMIKAFPGVGKGLLIDGLAALFQGKAVSFHEAIGPFSARMARCPVIVADETLAAGPGVNAVDELKKLVGDSAFSVADKYIRAAVLEGCVRVVLATNHHGGFRFGRELTVADVAALDQRVLLLQPANTCADYLDAIGGRAKTAAWVEGRGLARHVLWLAETRKVTTGGRFLVQGRGGLTDLLAGDSKGTVPLLTAVVHALRLRNDAVAIVDGDAWVAKGMISEQWSTLNTYDDPPSDVGTAWQLVCEPGSSRMFGKKRTRRCKVRKALIVQHVARLGYNTDERFKDFSGDVDVEGVCKMGSETAC